MHRFSKNDLLDLIKEVVSSIKEQKKQWLLESPETKDKDTLSEKQGQ
tara:strand:- start:2648 stop:2788 length:141 start_codon:yes stop_codon:yes gene_type:complete